MVSKVINTKYEDGGSNEFLFYAKEPGYFGSRKLNDCSFFSRHSGPVIPCYRSGLSFRAWPGTFTL